MSEVKFRIGDIVTLTSKKWVGQVGIVSQPISESDPGHVLVSVAGSVLGVSASMEEVVLADKNSEGHAQLAFNLIKLGSHVIERGLL